MATARVSRGRQSEQIAAVYLQGYYPDAKRRPASLPGSDVEELPFDLEVKATERIDLTGWLKQQDERIEYSKMGLVVYRPRGYGAATVANWPVVMRFHRAVDLLWKAGYR